MQVFRIYINKYLPCIKSPFFRFKLTICEYESERERKKILFRQLRNINTQKENGKCQP